jgi:translocation and assembly module TamA
MSQPEQGLSGTYLMPLDDPLRDQYRFQYGLRHRDNQDTRTNEAPWRLPDAGNSTTAGYRPCSCAPPYEDFTQAGKPKASSSTIPGSAGREPVPVTRAFPPGGIANASAFEYSDTAWGSDADFLRMTGDTEWIRMFGR